MLSPETDNVSESKQIKSSNEGLVKKRQCDFDWTEELKNDLSSKGKLSEDDDTDYAAMPPLETEEEYLKRKMKLLRKTEEEQQQLLQ